MHASPRQPEPFTAERERAQQLELIRVTNFNISE
jgi:hypothetical protein